MFKKISLILIFALSACQNNIPHQTSCSPTAPLEKKILKKKPHKLSRDLERLLARTNDLSKYTVKNDTNI